MPGNQGTNDAGLRQCACHANQRNMRMRSVSFGGTQKLVLPIAPIIVPTKGGLSHSYSVAFCSPAKSLTFSGLVENPLVGKKLKS